jgi:hypothetical protein
MIRHWISKPLAATGAGLLFAACTDTSASPTVLSEPEPLFAASATSEDVVMLATGQVAGTSKLVRNDSGVHMTFRTTGLEPGTVATIWRVLFNDPEECANPGNCTGTDSGNPAVDFSSFYPAGHVIGGSGKANYGASLPVGRLTVDPDPAANQLVRGPAQAEPGDGILNDARKAEIHLVLRTHGQAIPGLIQHQLSTFDAGCVTAPPALQGPKHMREPTARNPPSVGCARRMEELSIRRPSTGQGEGLRITAQYSGSA